MVFWRCALGFARLFLMFALCLLAVQIGFWALIAVYGFTHGLRQELVSFWPFFCVLGKLKNACKCVQKTGFLFKETGFLCQCVQFWLIFFAHACLCGVFCCLAAKNGFCKPVLPAKLCCLISCAPPLKKRFFETISAQTLLLLLSCCCSALKKFLETIVRYPWAKFLPCCKLYIVLYSDMRCYHGSI